MSSEWFMSGSGGDRVHILSKSREKHLYVLYLGNLAVTRKTKTTTKKTNYYLKCIYDHNVNDLFYCAAAVVSLLLLFSFAFFSI